MAFKFGGGLALQKLALLSSVVLVGSHSASTRFQPLTTGLATEAEKLAAVEIAAVRHVRAVLESANEDAASSMILLPLSYETLAKPARRSALGVVGPVAAADLAMLRSRSDAHPSALAARRPPVAKKY